MRIYFTFEPRPDLREPLVAEFPQLEFIFERAYQMKSFNKRMY